jgi:hypothetical protein
MPLYQLAKIYLEVIIILLLKKKKLLKVTKAKYKK